MVQKRKKNTKISQNLTENKQNSLYIFDFDDTLVKTSSNIVKKSDKSRFSAEEYNDFMLNNAILGHNLTENSFDFSEFDSIKDPKLVIKVFKLFEKLVNSGQNVVILTARRDGEQIKEYLRSQFNINIPVITTNSIKHNILANETSEKKAKWVESKIKHGINIIKYWDDSIENLYAVKKLTTKYPNVSIETWLVRPAGETQLVNEIEHFQKLIKFRHPNMKKTLIGGGSQPNMPPYTKKPSFKRSKSAPPGAGGV